MPKKESHDVCYIGSSEAIVVKNPDKKKKDMEKQTYRMKLNITKTSDRTILIQGTWEYAQGDKKFAKPYDIIGSGIIGKRWNLKSILPNTNPNQYGNLLENDGYFDIEPLSSELIPKHIVVLHSGHQASSDIYAYSTAVNMKIKNKSEKKCCN